MIVSKYRMDDGTVVDIDRRHNWGKQKKFWRSNADYWTLVVAHRQGNWIALAAVAGIAGALGIAIGKFLL